MPAIYNEIEAFAVPWLRALIAVGHVAGGTVDDRSIADLVPTDVNTCTQAHFFAGIGVWSYALRLAGWPDDRPVWTGSCPCQPFSAAGKGAGVDDSRHLWPEWFRLIDACRPPIIFGEQVASPAGLEWLDAVHADLEGAGYAVGAADLCAASVGAPHIRQRLYFVAYANGSRSQGRRLGRHGADQRATGSSGLANIVGDSDCQSGTVHAAQRQSGREMLDATGSGAAGELADADEERSVRRRSSRRGRSESEDCSAASGSWQDCDWIYCRDGKYRPVEPGTFPLVNGATRRVGRLRGYGNAIVAPLAAEFIRAVMDILPVA